MAFLSILLQIILLLVIARLMRRPGVSQVLSTSLLFLVIIWYVLPNFITIFFWDSITIPSIVDYDLFLSYSILESLMLLLTLVFLLRKRPYFQMIMDSDLARASVSPSLALLVVLIAVGWIWASNIVARDYVGRSYLEQNAFLVIAGGTQVFNNLGSFVFVQNLLACFCYACLLKKWPKGIQTRVLYFSLLVWIATTVFYQSLLGSRVILIMPFFLLVLYGQAQQWSKRKLMSIVAISAVGTLTVGGILAIIIAQSRNNQELKIQDIISELNKTVDTSFALDAGKELLTNIVTKFDSFSTGALLVEQMGAGAGGWQPYWGSVLAVVPRALLPSKPVPGSGDGTYLGHPSRLVAAAMGMYFSMGNVQVSPAAISIWQFGYLGLVVLFLFNLVHLYLINSLLLTRSIPLKSLGLFMIGIPTLLTLFTYADYTIMDMERILMVYAVLFFFHKIQRLRPSGLLAQRPIGRSLV